MKRSQRSRSFRKTRQNTPGGREKTKFVKKGVSKTVCAACRKPLPGTARGRKNGIRKVSSSRKTPNRVYGGNLCHDCVREMAKQKAFKTGA